MMKLFYIRLILFLLLPFYASRADEVLLMDGKSQFHGSITGLNHDGHCLLMAKDNRYQIQFPIHQIRSYVSSKPRMEDRLSSQVVLHNGDVLVARIDAYSNDRFECKSDIIGAFSIGVSEVQSLKRLRLGTHYTTRRAVDAWGTDHSGDGSIDGEKLIAKGRSAWLNPIKVQQSFKFNFSVAWQQGKGLGFSIHMDRPDLDQNTAANGLSIFEDHLFFAIPKDGMNGVWLTPSTGVQLDISEETKELDIEVRVIHEQNRVQVLVDDKICFDGVDPWVSKWKHEAFVIATEVASSPTQVFEGIQIQEWILSPKDYESEMAPSTNYVLSRNGDLWPFETLIYTREEDREIYRFKPSGEDREIKLNRNDIDFVVFRKPKKESSSLPSAKKCYQLHLRDGSKMTLSELCAKNGKLFIHHSVLGEMFVSMDQVLKIQLKEGE